MTRPIVIVLLLCAVVAGACSSGPAGDVGAGDVANGPTTTEGPVPSDDPGAAGTTTTRSRRDAPPTTAGTTTVRQAADGAGGSASTGPQDDDDGGRTGPPGAYARRLLRPEPATAIVLEVISQPGAAPRRSTIDLVAATLEEVSGKPVTVSHRTAPAGAPSGGWRVEDLVGLAESSGAARASQARAVVRHLALGGSFGPNDDAIGVAARGDLFATFTERIRGASTPLVAAETIEQAVAVHELGHLLGLVDVALDRNRDDPEHPHHSRNRGSVMFWAIETDVVGQILGGPPPRDFDDADLADLAALRAGA